MPVFDSSSALGEDRRQLGKPSRPSWGDRRSLQSMQTQQSFSNWNNSATSHPSAVAAPKDVAELIDVVKNSETYPSPVRAAGSLHSLNDCFVTSGTQILMKNFNDIRIDTGAQTITVGGGVKMVKIRDALRPHGLSTEVTPEIGSATAGSLACCGTKDASIGPAGLGQVSSSVIAVKMVNPQGEIEEVSEESDPERMRQIRSSYGLLGVIFEVTFKTMPGRVLKYDYKSFPLEPMANPRETLLGGADGALAFAQPYAKRIIVERRSVAGDFNLRISRFSKMKRYVRDKLWEIGVSFWPTLVPKNWMFAVLDRGLLIILRTISLLGGFRAHRYDSTIDFRFDRKHYFDFTFWAIPWSSWSAFVPDYVKFCEDFKKETGFRASLISEVYFMAQDNKSLMSPTKNEAVFTMDCVDTRTNDPTWHEFNRRFNTIAAKHGARPLLNQTKQMTKEIVYQTLGSDWEDFLKIRESEDPDGRFLNAFFKDLM